MAKSNILCTRAFEFRASGADGGDGRTLSGYAATFNDPTEINSWEGCFEERLSPGCFAKTLRENPKVVMQYDHGRDSRVGAIPIGSYTSLKEDSKGLAVEGRLFDNPVVEPVRQAIEAEAITGMSFKFTVVRDEWTDKDGKPISALDLPDLLWRPGDRGPLKRNIKEVKLYEAGPVTFAAYDSTSVGVRSGEPSGMDPADRAALIAEYARTMADPAPQEVADDGVVPDDRGETPGAESATLAPDESMDVAVDASPETATEDAARSGTSSGSTKRVIPAMRRVIPDLPAPSPR